MSHVVDEFFEHHGVKGMKWGVINEDSPWPSQTQLLKEKYGDDSQKTYSNKPVEERKGFDKLSSRQKKVALAVGGMALLGGAAYLHSKVGGKPQKTPVPFGGPNTEVMSPQMKEKLLSLADMPNRHISDGVDMHWDKGINLPAGSIVQRLSKVKETEIRPEGFFASFDKEDIDSYKLRLPENCWGPGWENMTGHMVQIKAKTEIKAPSGKESIDILKSIITDKEIEGLGYRGVASLSPEERERAAEGAAKAAFSVFSHHWVGSTEKDPTVQRYFAEVKKRGYNALIDFNDAGSLSKSPLRMLDGSNFEIIGHETVTPADIAKVREARNVLIAQRRQAREAARVLVETGVGHTSIIDVGESMKKAEDILIHYGVKGMKWGVRKDRGHEGERVKTKKLDKLDSKWQAKSGTMKNYTKVVNSSVDEVNVNLDRINSKPKYKGADFTNPSKLRDEYYEEVRSMTQAVYNKSADREIGVSPSGRYRTYFSVQEAGAFPSMLIGPNHEAEHADDLIEIELEWDEFGHIVSIGDVIDPLEQDDLSELVEDILVHYGIKGMKWGVRRSRVQLERGSDDHEETQSIKRQARSKGVRSLSNKEIQTAINRMNLEQNYARLTTQRSTLAIGIAKVRDILNTGKTVTDAYKTINNITELAKGKLDK